MKFKKENLMIVATLFLGLAVGIFVGVNFKDTFFNQSIIELNKNEASTMVLDFINSNFLEAQGQTASLVSLAEESGIYKFELKVEEEEFTSYVTKDGKYLFPQAFDMIPETFEMPKTSKPNVKLFVMSFCPFGTQAEQILNPIVGLLKDRVNFELAYIVSKNGEEFSSLHGEKEISQNVRELCVSKYYPSKFWDFVSKINNSCTIENIDNCWQNSANELGIDLNKIEACQASETNDLLNEQLALSEKSFKVQNTSSHNGSPEDFISSSPTLVINDFIFDGARSVEGYKEAICSAFIERPVECDQEVNQGINEVQGGCDS